MGDFHETCAISKLPIQGDESAYLIVLQETQSVRSDCYSDAFWKPITLPIPCVYKNFGRVEITNPEEDTLKYLRLNLRRDMVACPQRLNSENEPIEPFIDKDNWVERLIENLRDRQVFVKNPLPTISTLPEHVRLRYVLVSPSVYVYTYMLNMGSELQRAFKRLSHCRDDVKFSDTWEVKWADNPELIDMLKVGACRAELTCTVLDHINNSMSEHFARHIQMDKNYTFELFDRFAHFEAVCTNMSRLGLTWGPTITTCENYDKALHLEFFNLIQAEAKSENKRLTDECEEK